MSNLPESSTWEPSINQLEITDPVAGGPEGVMNQAPRQLANRTKFLYENTVRTTPGLSAFTGGDLLVATGAGTLSRLPIGATNRILVSTGSAPFWADKLAGSILPVAPFVWALGSNFRIVAREDPFVNLGAVAQEISPGAGMGAGIGWLFFTSPAGHVGGVELAIGLVSTASWPLSIRALGNTTVVENAAGSGHYSGRSWDITIGAVAETLRLSYDVNTTRLAVNWSGATVGTTRVSTIFLGGFQQT